MIKKISWLSLQAVCKFSIKYNSACQRGGPCVISNCHLVTEDKNRLTVEIIFPVVFSIGSFGGTADSKTTIETLEDTND